MVVTSRLNAALQLAREVETIAPSAMPKLIIRIACEAALPPVVTKLPSASVPLYVMVVPTIARL